MDHGEAGSEPNDNSGSLDEINIGKANLLIIFDNCFLLYYMIILSFVLVILYHAEILKTSFEWKWDCISLDGS